ncbi:MAG: hypothetical protein CL843_09500 [Crocinitomicaceae bacterium]|nr:hypothetical protein [Crocinitomicaceae bacterium]
MSWVGYKVRSAQQIFENLKSKISNPTSGLPEVTDYTESNSLIKELLIWSGIAEHLNYYIDFKARETFLIHQKLYKNAWAKAQEYDYRIKGVSAASGEVRFFINQSSLVDITIPYGTELESDLGEIVLTIESCIIYAGELYADCRVKQWVKKSNEVIGQSDGTANQSFVIASNVVDQSISLSAGSIPYETVESFVFSDSDDYHFRSTLNIDRDIIVELGDGINGKIPQSGDDITVDYYVSNGENIGIGRINKINTSPTLPTGIEISVSNIYEITGGGDREGLTDIQANIPKQNRTNNRAVSDQDYIDIAELYTGVELAGIGDKCGKTFKLYIYPEGGGIASQTLRDEVYNYFDDKRMNTSKLVVYSAGEVIVQYNVDVVVLNNFNQTATENNVISALLDYHSEIRKVGGVLRQGNIYQLIESVTGVDYCIINEIIAIPSPIPYDSSTPDISWDVQIDSSIISSTWKIKFDSTTGFKVFTGTQFIGSFQVGDVVEKHGLTFSILQNYQSGNTWTFNTYEVSTGLELDEPSVLNTNTASITLNMSGGI